MRTAAQRLQALLQEFGLSDLLHTRFTLPEDNASSPLVDDAVAPLGA